MPSRGLAKGRRHLHSASFFITIMVVGVALCAASPKPSSSPTTWRLSPEELGPLRIGADVEDVERVLGVRLKTWDRDPAKLWTFECDQPAFDGYRGLQLLFESGRLNGITIFQERPRMTRGSGEVDLTGVATVEGLRIGSSEADARRLYGDALKVEARPYYEDGPAHDLTVRDQATHRGIVLETNEKGVIDTIRVGGDSISFMEGCA